MLPAATARRFEVALKAVLRELIEGRWKGHEWPCRSRRDRVPVDEDVQYEAGLRPRTLDEYIGQDRIRENLQVSTAAARQRARRSITCCSTARPGSARPRWRT